MQNKKKSEKLFIIDDEFLKIAEGVFDKIYTIERESTIRFFIPYDTPNLSINPIMKWNYPTSPSEFER